MSKVAIEVSTPVLAIVVSTICASAAIVGAINAQYLSSINSQLVKLAESDARHTQSINKLDNRIGDIEEDLGKAISTYQLPQDYWASFYDDAGKHVQVRLHRAQFFKERKEIE
ncbi:hypothetical protein [Vibrio astriarenae]|uniref:hypothetical protein n=1 Tax=Vibrio astriarenae TaxID=1481923 RepID=UPI0037365954